MADQMVSCVEPISQPVITNSDTEPRAQHIERETKMEVARVGKKAPDFTANAYFAGAFKQVSLSDYSGKWVVLCFYPGDFTFV